MTTASAVARRIHFTEINASLFVRAPPIQPTHGFQLLEHLLHFVLVLGTKQRVARRRSDALTVAAGLSPELAIRNAVEQRFPRVAPQVPEQTCRGIEIAGINDQKTVPV